MGFFRGTGFFILGWFLASIPVGVVVGAIGGRGTQIGDSVQVISALVGGIAMVIYKRGRYN